MDAFWSAVLVGGLALIGTLIGHFVTHKSNVQSTKSMTEVIVYRIDILEKKVELHNNLVDRAYCLEGELTMVKEKLHRGKERIEKMEERLK